MRIRGLGFAEEATEVLARHFLDADARGRTGHGLTRVDWLSTLPDLRPEAEPKRLVAEPGYERWEGNGALGYLTLDAIVRMFPEAGRYPFLSTPAVSALVAEIATKFVTNPENVLLGAG